MRAPSEIVVVPEYVFAAESVSVPEPSLTKLASPAIMAGTVKSVEPGPRDYKVTVEFDEYGQKIMYAAFAKLVKC